MKKKLKLLLTLILSFSLSFVNVNAYTLTEPLNRPVAKGDGRGEAIEHLTAEYGKSYEDDPNLEEAVIESRRWHWNKAYTYLDNFVKEHPKYLDAYRLQAELYLTNSQYDEALSQLDQILKQHPDDTHALAVSAMVQVMRGDLDDAKARKNALEEVNKNYAKALETVYNTVQKYYDAYSLIDGEVKLEYEPELIAVFGHSPKKNGKLPRTLENKVKKAKELLEEYPNAKILVTGGPVRQEMSEASVMKGWLVENGVEEDKIIMDELARDTYGNAVGILTYMKENNLTKVVAVSDFHHLVRCQSNLHLYASSIDYPIEIQAVGTNTPSHISEVDKRMPYIYYNALKSYGMVEKDYYKEGVYDNEL